MFKVILVAFALLVVADGQFTNWFNKCNNGWQSYFKTGRCDHFEDCFDGSDEWNCGGQAPTTTKASPMFFHCNDMLKIIPWSWKCNNFYDCYDRSDEWNCGRTPAPTHKPTPAPPTPAPPTPAPPGPSGCSCGCTPIEPIGDVAGQRDWRDDRHHIIGGQVAKPNSWPWQIWLTIRVGIGSQSDSSLSDYTIHAGMFKTWDADQKIGVSSVHPHPNYPDYPVRANWINPYVGGLDIALIKVNMYLIAADAIHFLFMLTSASTGAVFGGCAVMRLCGYAVVRPFRYAHRCRPMDVYCK